MYGVSELHAEKRAEPEGVIYSIYCNMSDVQCAAVLIAL